MEDSDYSESTEQADDNMIEIKYVLPSTPNYLNQDSMENETVDEDDDTDYIEMSRLQKKSVVSLKTHKYHMKAKQVIIEELQAQVKQLEEKNKELERENLKLKEEDEVKVVHEVIRNNCQATGNQNKPNKTKRRTTCAASVTKSSRVLRNAIQKKPSGVEIENFKTSKHRVKYFNPRIKHCECSCGRLYRSWGSLKYHLRVKNFGSVFKCTLCDRKYSSNNFLKFHLKQIHNVKWTGGKIGCWTCGVTTFNTRKEITEHYREVHSNGI